MAYEQIKVYVLEQTERKVFSLHIVQIKKNVDWMLARILS